MRIYNMLSNYLILTSVKSKWSTATYLAFVVTLTCRVVLLDICPICPVMHSKPYVYMIQSCYSDFLFTVKLRQLEVVGTIFTSLTRIKFALRAILACKNSPHNNNMSSKWQRNETSSQPVCSSDQEFELSVLELSRFDCICSGRLLVLAQNICFEHIKAIFIDFLIFKNYVHQGPLGR